MEIGLMLEQSAARFGEKLAVAVVDDGDANMHTFESLDTASNRIANGLLKAGIGYGNPVALLSRNSIQFVETLFATQKIGAPVVPVNARFDVNDVTYVLDDVDPVAVVVEEAFVEDSNIESLLRNRDCSVFVVGRHDEFPSYVDLSDGSTIPPGVPVDGDTVDGYFYTSGSSGRPKGVVHRHSDRLFVNMNIISELGLRHSDVNCNPLPLFHSGPLYTGFMPFVQFGVPSIIFREFDAEATLKAIEQWDATVLGGVPAQYNRLSKAAEDGDFGLDSLRFWWVSGAPMTEQLRDRCRETLCSEFSNIYGATEMGPPVSTLPPEECDERPESCGNGHMGQEIRVVEPDGDADSVVEPGETGELIVRGESVMDRYLNRPEMTAEVMANGWYYTGDIARRDDEGYLYVEGRKDDMIISGGENLYPTEVEDVLLEHEAVDDVAVIGVDHEEWGQTPKAFVVANDDIGPDHVVDHCLTSDLADYKRPREVILVPEIPRNPSGGSVLKDELRAMD